METVISKSYGGAQTRLILPKEKDVAGVTGDNRSTRLRFKLPKPYATGWSKFIEFDCTVERDYSDVPGVTRSTEGPTEIYPCYPLESDDSFLVPYEIASQGGEIKYNLKFVSEDGTVVEKSELGTLYFRNSVDGEDAEPEEYVDIITILANNAYCSVSYDDGTREGASETVLPTLTFSPWMSGGESDTITLNVPYLDSNGHILNRFIDKEVVVEIFHISSPDALVSLTQAQIPDMALIDQSASTETYYMDLYMLVGADPTVAPNWYLVHTDNPTFGAVHATSADFNSTTTVGLTVTGDEAVSGNVAVTGQVTTAQVNTPKIAGTGTSPNAPLEITGATTVKNGLTVEVALATPSFTDNGSQVNFTNKITAPNVDISAKNVTVNTKTTTGTLESGAAKFTGNIDASGKTVTASTFTGDLSGNATTATTAQNYDSTTGTIKQHVDTHGADQTYGHVKFKQNITADTTDTTVSEKGIKDFVNSSINAVAAYYITYNAQGDRFPSAEALKTASTLYSGGQVRVPTRNDYAVVIADATHMEYSTYYPYTSFTTTAQYVDHYVDYNNAKTLVTQANKDNLGIVPGTTVAYEGIASDARYIYAGTGDTYDGTKWEYNFPLGRTFTNAEMLAIDSGITADKVNKLDGIASGAQVNVLEAVKVNGTPLSITNKAVDISVTPNDESTTYVDWDTSTTIATVAGTPIKIKIPANPDTDQLVRQKLQTGNYNLPLILAHNTITSTDENVTDIVYRNNSIYANPSTGSIYATKVYSNNSEVVNLASDQNNITGYKTFTNGISVIKSYPRIGMRDTTGVIATTDGGDAWLYFTDKNGAPIGRVFNQIVSPTGGVEHSTVTGIQAVSKNGSTDVFSGISIYALPTGTVYATAPTRDYDSNNAKDIVTIGSLQNSTDVVHRSGNEDILGFKTFRQGAVYIRGSGSRYLSFINTNSAFICDIRADDNGAIGLRPGLASGGTKAVWVQDQRAYDPANTGDVVTIGTLNSAIEIGGSKTFTGSIFSKGNNVLRAFTIVNNDMTIGTPVDGRFSTIDFLDKNGTISNLQSKRLAEIAHGYGTGANTIDIRAYDAYENTGVYSYIQSICQSDGVKFGITSYRATPAQDDEILTRGNGVTLTTAQTVSGIKTHSAQLNLSYGAPTVALKTTSYAYNERVSNATTLFSTSFNDKNGKYIGGLIGRWYTDGGHRTNIESTSENNTLAQLNLWAMPDGTCYAQCPNRAYDATHTSDIVNIGMLNTAMSLDGAKTFSASFNAKAGILIGDPTSTSNSWGPEIYGATPFIDFHHNSSSNDYTARIINSSNGALMFTIRNDDATNSKNFILNSAGFITGYGRAYSSTQDTDVLVKAHVPDLISANVGNGQISLTSSRGVAIDNFTVNQSAGKNIVLPAGSTQYTDQSMTFSLQSTPDFSDYPYMASKSITGLTADMYATVTFDDAQVSSGQYAPFCQTLAGEVRLYAKSNVGTITVPTISVGMDDSSAQQSMSNFVTLTGAQTIGGVKTYTSRQILSYTSMELYNSSLALQSQGYDISNPPSYATRGIAQFNIGANLDQVATRDECVLATGGNSRSMIVHSYSSSNQDQTATFSLTSFRDGSACMRGPSRTYNSSNTTDIVTIGSLQASTDVVHRSGAESIVGSKTFLSAVRSALVVCSSSGNHYYIVAKLKNIASARYYGMTFIASRNTTITIGGVGGQVYSGGNTCTVTKLSNNDTLNQVALGIGTYGGSTYLIAKATRQVTASFFFTSAVSGTQDNIDTVLETVTPTEISAPSDYLEGGFVL